MIEVVDFENAWSSDHTRYEISGELLHCIDPKGMLLLSIERLEKEGPTHAILLDDTAVIDEVLKLRVGRTGPSFLQRATVSALVERTSGKFGFRMKHVFAITILDCIGGPKTISFNSSNPDPTCA